ncbi:unnamed protein product [Protopolystoma xenopodis]|uniref:Uncharacterized protein n=1 Tax=Protopolystoma xenopodis TaxID=117903 RepID=A0A448X7X9_9PLAT|nr:unnamed protein product [Protopolystoma xenopodis]
MRRIAIKPEEQTTHSVTQVGVSGHRLRACNKQSQGADTHRLGDTLDRRPMPNPVSWGLQRGLETSPTKRRTSDIHPPPYTHTHTHTDRISAIGTEHEAVWFESRHCEALTDGARVDTAPEARGTAV